MLSTDLPIDTPLSDLSNVLSNEPELETPFHLEQIILLIQGLKWWWRDRSNFFAEGNISIYYRPAQIQSDLGSSPDDRNDRPSSRFRGPDFFVVLDAKPKERSSWIVWQEDDKYPNVIVEVISQSTAKVDRGLKKQLYQEVFKTPEYFWVDPRPRKLEFKGFRLSAGEYQEILPNEQGWRWSQELQLYLGLANGKLRYFTPEGMLVPTPEEAAIQAQQRATRLADQLRALGIEPDCF